MFEFIDAPCLGSPQYFDVADWQTAKLGLSACSQCPYRLECLRIVDPAASWYEGVCGGMLWVSGKPMIKEWKRMKPERRPYADLETTEVYLETRFDS